MALNNSTPLIKICNRCVPYMNDDLEEYHCDADFGPFATKCTRCVSGKHACVATDQALVPFLNDAVRARAALARNLRDDDAPDAGLLRAARVAADTFTTKLKVFDRNRNKLAGDRASPRKAGTSGAPAGRNTDVSTLEMQSLRRGVLALVEVGKIAVGLAGATPARLARVDALLGQDGPAAALSESEGEEPGEEEEEWGGLME
ncbi:hypothetical protein LTR95_007409 [Oleoguttula sp. CCFEE 5521]